jgi:hypothetical protein
MARLAQRLGHPFEAILFFTVAIAEDPGSAQLRADLHRLEEAARGPDSRTEGLLSALPPDCDEDRLRFRLP